MRTKLLSDTRLYLMADCLSDNKKLAEVVTTGYSGRSVLDVISQSTLRRLIFTGLALTWAEVNSRGKRRAPNSGDVDLKPAFLEYLDDISGMPGFGDAMEQAGFVEVREDYVLTFPNFCDGNHLECERQDEKRKKAEQNRIYYEQKKRPNGQEDSANIQSTELRATVQNRTVQNKEEKKPSKKKVKKAGIVTADDVELPEYLNSDAGRKSVDEWLAHKREIKKTVTAAQLAKTFGKYETLAAFSAAVDHSIANGWTGLFAPDAAKGGGKAAGWRHAGPMTRRQQELADAKARLMAGSEQAALEDKTDG